MECVFSCCCVRRFDSYLCCVNAFPFFTHHLHKNNRKNWVIPKFEYFFTLLNVHVYFCRLTVAYDELNQSAHLDAKCRRVSWINKPLISAAHRRTEARATRRFMTDVVLVFFLLVCVHVVVLSFVLSPVGLSVRVREHDVSTGTHSVDAEFHCQNRTFFCTPSGCSCGVRSTTIEQITGTQENAAGKRAHAAISRRLDSERYVRERWADTDRKVLKVRDAFMWAAMSRTTFNSFCVGARTRLMGVKYWADSNLSRTHIWGHVRESPSPFTCEPNTCAQITPQKHIVKMSRSTNTSMSSEYLCPGQQHTSTQTLKMNPTLWTPSADSYGLHRVCGTVSDKRVQNRRVFPMNAISHSYMECESQTCNYLRTGVE